MRFIIFLFFLTFSAFSYSAPYQWQYPSEGPYPAGSKSSPTEACTTYLQNFNNAYPGNQLWRFHSVSVSGSGYSCFGMQDAGLSSHRYYSTRTGDSCELPDATYNTQTGECEAPPKNECEEKAGDSSPYNKSGDIGDGYLSIVTIGGKKLHVSPNDACMGGCAVVVQSNCIPTISTNRYRCTGNAYYTGTSCTASNDAPQVEQEENYVPDEPKNTEIKEPCIYTTDSEGRSVCVSKASLEKEGQHCGEYNGKTLCVPKEATTDEKTVQTEVTETSEPDGGKKIVKKDVATVTKCTASKQNCTTTTTTTTTTSKSDGSGATTSTTVECKGKDCGAGIGGGGAGSGSSDGDDDEDVPGELEGQDEVAEFGESLQDFNTRISAAPILATVTSIAMPRGGSCSMPSANIPVIGSISFNWICDNADLLDPLYYVMLAIWALFATRVFLEA